MLHGLSEARTITPQVAATYRFAKQSRNLTMGIWEKLNHSGRKSCNGEQPPLKYLRPRQPCWSVRTALTTGASKPITWHPRPIERYYAVASPQHPFLLYHRLPQAVKCVQQLLFTGKGRARLREATNKTQGNQFSAQSCAILRNLAQAQETETTSLAQGNDWKILCVTLCIKPAEESVPQK